MTTDCNGNELNIGDTVFLKCTVMRLDYPEGYALLELPQDRGRGCWSAKPEHLIAGLTAKERDQ